MRVGVLDQNSYPSDAAVRVEKIVDAIRDAGHEVVVLCPNHPGRARRETVDDAHRIRRFGMDTGPIWKRLICHPFPGNPFWIFHTARMIREERLDAVIGCSLRVMFAAAIAARLRRRPSVFDMAEYYPGMWLLRERTTRLDRILKGPLVNTVLERWAVHLADHTWVVVPDQRIRLAADRHDPARISVVSNTPELPREIGALPVAAERATPGTPLRLLYIGFLARMRGLHLVIRALGLLRRAGDVDPLPRFTVVGDGDARSDLERLVAEEAVEELVDFRGWRPRSELGQALASHEVGVVPHEVSAFTHHTIPNKLFDSMLYGLAVIATPMRPVERVLESSSCGIIADETPEAFAAAIRRLDEDRELLRTMGREGRKAVEEHYNWSIDAAEVVGTLERLHAMRLRREADAAADTP